jgi:hypothetical protein
MQLGALTVHKRSSHPPQPEFATFATASLLIFRSTKVRSSTHIRSQHTLIEPKNLQPWPSSTTSRFRRITSTRTGTRPPSPTFPAMLTSL